MAEMHHHHYYYYHCYQQAPPPQEKEEGTPEALLDILNDITQRKRVPPKVGHGPVDQSTQTVDKESILQNIRKLCDPREVLKRKLASIQGPVPTPSVVDTQASTHRERERGSLLSFRAF